MGIPDESLPEERHGASQHDLRTTPWRSIRKWCKICGGHFLTEHPAMGLTDVYAAILPKLAFRPGLHVFYEVTVLHVTDGLPKQKDVRAELGGSGVLLAE